MRIRAVGCGVCVVSIAAGLAVGTAVAGDPPASSPRQQLPGGNQRAVVGGSVPYSVGRALPDRIGTWTRAPQVHMYRAADLWEYIDGAAEQYLAYGFQELATSKYSDKAGSIVSADIYRMAEPVGAFGIFRQELSPKARSVSLGVEGRAGTTSIKFWTGSFYVKLTAAPGGGRTPDLEELAAAIARGLGAPGGMPPQVNWFPPAGLLPDSIRFVPADALGQASFTNAFEAKYEDPREPSRALVVPFDSEATAAAALTRYESFFAKASGKSRVASPGHGGFAATDSFQGFVFAVRAGSRLVVSLGASNERAAAALVTEIVRRLPPIALDLPKREGEQ